MAQTNYKIRVGTEGVPQAKESLGSITNTLGDIQSALGGLGSAAEDALSKISQSAAAYEYELARVSTLATEATEGQQGFKQALEDTARSTNGLLDVTKGAAGAYEVLSAGFDDQEAILSILTESTKTAVAGFTDYESVAAVTAKTLTVYGEELSKVGNTTAQVKLIQDQLVQTQNLGSITVGQYTQGIGNLLSTAKASGVSLTELNAAIAQITAEGGQPASAMTDLAQVISSLAKPTQEAAELIEQYDLQVGSAALESLGFAGVMADIREKVGDNSEALRVLFSGTEAYRSAVTFLGDAGERWEGRLKSMTEATGTQAAAFEKMAATKPVQLEMALTRLQNQFAILGEAALEMAEPLLDALDQVLDTWESLDPAAQKTIVQAGLLAAALVAGVTALTGAALATGAVVAGIKSVALAMGAGQLAALGFTGALKAIAIALPGLVLGLIAVNNAVKLAAHTYKYWQDLQAEEKANEGFLNLQTTEKAAKGIERLGNELKKSGKAIPDAEFARLIERYKTLDGGTGTLTAHIKALTTIQERNKKAMTEGANATGQQTKAAFDQAASYKTLKASTEKLISAAESRKRADLAAAARTPENVKRLELETKAYERYAQVVTAAQRKLLTGTGATDAEKAKANAKIAQVQADLADRRAQLMIAREEELRSVRSANADKAVEDAKRVALAKGEELGTSARVEAALRNKAQTEAGILREQISKYRQGSKERTELELKLSQVLSAEAQRQKGVADSVASAKKAAEDKVTQAKEKARADQERIAREKEEAEKARLAAIKDRLDQEAKAQENTAQRRILSLQQIKAALDAQAVVEGAQGGLLGAAGSGLDALKGVQDAAAANQAKLKDLQKAEKVDQDAINQAKAEGLKIEQQQVQARRALQTIQGALLSNGISINTQGTLDQQIQNAIVGVEQARLDLKARQLETARELQAIELETARAQAEGDRDIARIKQQDPSLKAADRERAKIEEDIAKTKLGTLDKAERAQQRAYELQKQSLEIEKAIAAVKTPGIASGGAAFGAGGGGVNRSTPKPSSPAPGQSPQNQSVATMTRHLAGIDSRTGDLLEYSKRISTATETTARNSGAIGAKIDNLLRVQRDTLSAIQNLRTPAPTRAR